MTRRDTRDIAETGADEIHAAPASRPPSPFTCPECGGALWLSHDGELLQFHCHVGHRFSGEALVSAHDDSLELALWTALRALEESAELRRRMAMHASERGMTDLAERYARDGQESEQRAAVIRRVLLASSDVAPASGAVPLK